MNEQNLTGAWRFRQLGAEAWLPASVPGGVHTDLLAAGAIPDPFVADNELQVQWIPFQDWEYQRSFVPAPELLAEQQVELVCDGLDTLAELRLNGQLLGSTNNQLHSWRWQVGPLLRPGENELTITFSAPMRYVNARMAERKLTSVEDMLIPGGQYLRKAPYHFGWDWGPKLVTVGIWRALRLEGHSTARLEDVHLRQQHSGGQVTVSASAAIERWGAGDLTIELVLTAPDGTAQRASAPADAQGELSLVVERPQLWWPNGYGAQPLYQAEVRLLTGGTPIDTRRYQLGLRALELRQHDDEWGRSFTFAVNGQPLFAKGANWIPADSFPARVTDAQLEHLIKSAADTHMNMLRIWGGGYYESEAFYDLCDRYGLLIWQDFMFACAVYPLHDQQFVAGVAPEVAEQVRRLRHRACLALWCGNNELEVAWAGWGWDKPADADLKAGYARFFHATLPAWVAEHDPERSYWPSSPSSDQQFADPNGDARGDTHLWDVWHALKPFEHYRTSLSRFVSEFGFQSLPALATVNTYAEPADQNMTSYIMEHHQRNTGGNGRIVSYMTANFQLPKDFDALVYLTQILQAEAMRIGVEHWRRNWPRCAGALYWQLNDCWPVASWASIDSLGRWKATQYAARRFFAPAHLSVETAGLTPGLFVHNDHLAPWAGDVRWSLETFSGAVLAQGAQLVELGPLSVARAAVADCTALVDASNRRDVALVAELWQAGQRLVLGVTPFAPDKHLRLPDPAIAAEVSLERGRLSVRLRADSLARYVELALDGADVVWSDNYLDLPAGRDMTVSCALPAGWGLERARAALRVRSLVNSYRS